MRIVIVLALCVFLVGCVSAAHQAQLDEKSRQLADIVKKTDDIRQQMKDGVLSSSDGLKLIVEQASETARIIAEINKIKSEGDYTFWEILGSIIGGAALSLLSVLGWRGGVTSRKGTSP